jgi:hypothetical protein
VISAARGGHLDAVAFLFVRGACIDEGVPGDSNALRWDYPKDSFHEAGLLRQ